MPIVHQRELRGGADRREADRLHEPPDIPAGGSLEADGGVKPWPESEPPLSGYGVWGSTACGGTACGFASSEGAARDGVLAAAWLPRAAPNANAAVSAAAPPAAQAVIVFTRQRAPALSIAMGWSLQSVGKEPQSSV
jgi:hypothetical protein